MITSCSTSSCQVSTTFLLPQHSFVQCTVSSGNTLPINIPPFIVHLLPIETSGRRWIGLDLMDQILCEYRAPNWPPSVTLCHRSQEHHKSHQATSSPQLKEKPHCETISCLCSNYSGLGKGQLHSKSVSMAMLITVAWLQVQEVRCKSPLPSFWHLLPRLHCSRIPTHLPLTQFNS